MNTRILALAASVAFVTPAFAQGMPDPATVKTADQFVPMATVGNLFEIQSSQLALQHDVSDDVEAFAQQMVDDHTKAGEDLEAALADSGLDITPPTELDAKHQGMLDQLEAASDDSFEATYIDLQVAAHDEAVALFSSYADGGDNETLVNFASTTLPTLEEHQEHVNALDAGGGMEPMTGTTAN